MNNLKAKLKKEGGFTLIEMLIVVAIIAILIAISIPMVNKALERSREATDAANERAALGLAMVEVLSENKLGGTPIADAEISAVYKVADPSTTTDAAGQGTLVATGTSGSSGFNYGKGTKAGDIAVSHVNMCIKVTFNPTETDATKQFKIEWI